jgi:flagellar operon protein
MDRMMISQPIKPVNKLQESAVTPNIKKSGVPFNQFLQQQIEKLKFSQHALARLQLRNINLTAEQINKINDAVSKAAAKGAKEALILMDNLAMVVSVKNRTVITVVDKTDLKDNVFTNIDSAVII